MPVTRLRLNVWSPRRVSSSGAPDYADEQAEALSRHHQVRRVTEACPPAGLPEADLDLYHVGNSPAYAFTYRAALRRPGVVLLHDFGLQHLWLGLSLSRGERHVYLNEMRRAHGENGTFVGRQLLRSLAGELWPVLYPANDRLLEASLAVVGLTRAVAAAAGKRVPRPLLCLPRHLSLPAEAPSREEARSALGLDAQARVVTAPGLATSSRRMDAAVAALARLRDRFPRLLLVVAGDVDPQLPLRAWADAAGFRDGLRVSGRLSPSDSLRYLAAADLVLALCHPSQGEISGALVQALGIGRPTLVSGATAAANEFPEGVVVPVDPGRAEEASLFALLSRLLDDPELCARIGRAAAAHVRSHHDLAATAECLAGFLAEVHARKPALRQDVARSRAPQGSLLGRLLDEARAASHDMGLADMPHDVAGLLEPLA